MAVEILVIDDEEDVRDTIADVLEDAGYTTRKAENIQQAEACLNERLPSLVLLDVWLSENETDGLNLLKSIKKRSADVPVIMISGHSTVEMSASAIKMGAQDFISKPFETEQLTHCIERALKEMALFRENRELQLSTGDLVPQWIGESSVADELNNKIKKLSQSSSRIIIWGERGVGKATIARLIHKHSGRSLAHFNVLNCGSVSAKDFESELLGVEVDKEVVKIGALENSHRGVLLLEDIDKMPKEFQGQFAKILHSGSFNRVGGSRSVKVDVRVMVTCLMSPQVLKENGILQSDLFHRLNVDEVYVKPLRDRPDDIEPFFNRFVKLRSASLRCPEPTTEAAGIGMLQAYDWGGNLRQMKHIVERLLGEGNFRKITASQIEACLVSEDSLHDTENDSESLAPVWHFEDGDLRTARNAFEKEYLGFHLRKFGGNIAKTAEAVGMERTALHRKLKSLDLL